MLVRCKLTQVHTPRGSRIQFLESFARTSFYCAMLRRERYCHGKSCVRPSLTLRYCDYISWNSSKIISRLISLVFLLSADPTSWIHSKRNTLKMDESLLLKNLLCAMLLAYLPIWAKASVGQNRINEATGQMCHTFVGNIYSNFNCMLSGVVSYRNNSGNAKLERRRRESIETPKAPRGVGWGEEVSPSPLGVWGGAPSPEKFFNIGS